MRPTRATDRFADDLVFLREHGDVMTLRDSAGAQIAIMPALQGRVLTSTSGGGESFGWINRHYFRDFQAGNRNPAISPFGGEDRLWLGPEAGPFSVFFKPGDPIDLKHWAAPPCFDVEPFDVIASSSDRVTFSRRVSLMNYSKTQFEIQIERGIRLIGPAEALTQLGVSPVSDVRIVAFESNNQITNEAPSAWNRRTGLLSIWILGMFNASADTTVVLPVKPGASSQLGQKVSGDYFGQVPPDRLHAREDTVFFKADGRQRGKIGISPRRARPIFGSYDALGNVLTLVQYTLDEHAREYVNSHWGQQDRPYDGDVVNSYNDGPATPGGPQLGQFYELETSSAAVELKKGESLRHVHRTFHVTGNRQQIDGIARTVLGVGLDQITCALPR